MRDVAIAFPQDWPVDEPLRVRVSGGNGFWRVDSLAVSALLEARPPLRRVLPRSAIGIDGGDQTAVLAAADGRYNTLSRDGDWLEARFDLPPVPPGARRAVFLFTNGYYNPHPPSRPDRSLRTLKRIRDEEGALVRYGHEYYSTFASRAANAGHGGR
jgi:hypothetical protein